MVLSGEARLGFTILDEVVAHQGVSEALKPFLGQIGRDLPSARITPPIFQELIKWLDRSNAWSLVAPDFPLASRGRIRWATPDWLLPEALQRDTSPATVKRDAVRQALARIKVDHLFRSSPLGCLSDRLSEVGILPTQQIRGAGRGWRSADWIKALHDIIGRGNLTEMNALLHAAGTNRILGLVLATSPKTVLESHWPFLQAAATQNDQLQEALSAPCHLGTVFKHADRRAAPVDFVTLVSAQQNEVSALSTTSNQTRDLAQVLLPHPLAALLLVDTKPGRGFCGMSLHSLVDKSPHPLTQFLTTNIPMLAKASSLHPALMVGLADILLSGPLAAPLSHTDAAILSGVRTADDRGLLHVCVDIIATYFEPAIMAAPPKNVLDNLCALTLVLESASPGEMDRPDTFGWSFQRRIESLERLGLPPLPPLDRNRLMGAVSGSCKTSAKTSRPF